MANVTVTKEWLEEGLQASRELAWAISTIIQRIEEDPEGAAQVLQHCQIAASEQAKGFAMKLGVDLEGEMPKGDHLRVVEEVSTHE